MRNFGFYTDLPLEVFGIFFELIDYFEYLKKEAIIDHYEKCTHSYTT